MLGACSVSAPPAAGPSPQAGPDGGAGGAQDRAGGAPAPLAPSACPGWLDAQRAGQGRLYALDPAASTVRIHVFRAGKLAALGHNHVIAAEPRLVGQVFVPGQGLDGAGVELGFRLDELVLDRADWRAALGGDFARPLSESDIAGTRTNMLRALEAERYPVVRAASVAVQGAWPRLALRVDVSLHGQTRPLDLALTAAQPVGDGALQAKGQWVLRQSDFGVQPFTVLGGLLAIQDALVIDLDLVARPAAACAALPQ